MLKLMGKKYSQFDFNFFFSIDPEQKDQLVEVIEKLLGDKTTVSSEL